MKKASAASLVMLGMQAMAIPVVLDSNVELNVDRPRFVKIGYTLGNEPAVVTVDILTNGVSIGERNFRSLSGDVNRLVQPGKREIVWNAKTDVNGVEKLEIQAEVRAWSTNCPPDYMVVDLVGHGSDPRFRYYVSTDAMPFAGGVNDDLCKTEYMVFRKIPAAGVVWRMGAGAKSTTEGDARECDGSKESPHLVTLPDDYYMGIYEVTQRQYTNGYYTASDSLSSKFICQGDLRPVENMDYNTIRGGVNWPVGGRTAGTWGFLSSLQRAVGAPSGMFDLPTEAEWEYACRSGCPYAYNNGGKSNWDSTTLENTSMSEVGRYRWNATPSHASQTYTDADYPTLRPEDGGTAVVGSYRPNAWGLYDMHGNVQEICLDGFCQYTDSDYDPLVGKVPAADGDADGFSRVLRGGSWNSNGHCCRAAKRDRMGRWDHNSRTGFRLWSPARAVK